MEVVVKNNESDRAIYFMFQRCGHIISWNSQSTWVSIAQFKEDYWNDIPDDDSYLEYLVSLIPKEFER